MDALMTQLLNTMGTNPKSQVEFLNSLLQNKDLSEQTIDNNMLLGNIMESFLKTVPTNSAPPQVPTNTPKATNINIPTSNTKLTQELSIKIPFDIRELETCIVIYFDLPGVKKEDIKLQIQKYNLYLNAKRYYPIGSDAFHIKERTEGEYARTVGLPKNIDRNSVNVKYENGVLIVKFLKEDYNEDFKNIVIE